MSSMPAMLIGPAAPRNCRRPVQPSAEPLFLLGGDFGFRAGQLFGVDDGLVDRAAGSAEIGKLAVGAVALQHIDRRNRLAADLVGGRALDDRPMHPAGPGLL